MRIRQVVPKDAIPSVDDPEFFAADAYVGESDDQVIGVDGDPSRAYPFRYLDFHEIVNTERDGHPIAVTWCPLCGTAVAYDRVIDGRTLTFGVSGKLVKDNLVMYDRETDSLWRQSTGVAIEGPMDGAELSAEPAWVTTFDRFRQVRPSGQVLAPPGGESETAGSGTDQEPIDYDENPYREYVESDGFGLRALHGGSSREWNRTDFDPKTIVIGVQADEAALGFPRPAIEEAGGVVTASVGDLGVLVFATPDGLHAYADPGHEFRSTEMDGRFSGDGTTWDGVTGQAADGRSLRRLPAIRTFAFAWQDDHGSDGFFDGP
ncbi:MAG: hypothetical protein ACI8VE_000619 [Natrialbaceae archaeon]|jgi:hypothetical protein